MSGQSHGEKQLCQCQAEKDTVHCDECAAQLCAWLMVEFNEKIDASPKAMSALTTHALKKGMKKSKETHSLSNNAV